MVIELHWLVLSVGILLTLIYLVLAPVVKEWLHRRRKRKAYAVLRHELESRAKEFDLNQQIKGLTWERNTILEENESLRKENESLREEVERLCRRSRILTNELRSDEKALTQVLPPTFSARFMKKP